MTNHALVNLLAWCKRERESLQMQFEMLQSGTIRLHEKDEAGRLRDISDQNIQQITANITELDAIIADYEANRA